MTGSRMRTCRRASCPNAAVATLTYVYADQTAVLGPLATQADPHGYDLCADHALTLTAPRGWQVIRLADNFDPPPPSSDDLEALADAVREAARPRTAGAAVADRRATPAPATPPPRPASGRGRPRHLFAVPPPE